VFPSALGPSFLLRRRFSRLPTCHSSPLVWFSPGRATGPFLSIWPLRSGWFGPWPPFEVDVSVLFAGGLHHLDSPFSKIAIFFFIGTRSFSAPELLSQFFLLRLVQGHYTSLCVVCRPSLRNQPMKFLQSRGCAGCLPYLPLDQALGSDNGCFPQARVSAGRRPLRCVLDQVRSPPVELRTL